MIKLVAISSSPIQDGNNELLTAHMVDTAIRKGCAVENFHLSRLKIEACTHCNACIGKQKPGRYCVLEDDAQSIFESLEQADIVLLSSPVYHMRMNSRMAALTDRMRVFIFGNITGGKMKNKIGISAAVAWKRHGGFETTHLSHMFVFYNLDMLPVGCHHSISPLGASAVSSRNGQGVFDKKIRTGILEDESGLKSGAMLVERAVDIAGIMKGGK